MFKYTYLSMVYLSMIFKRINLVPIDDFKIKYQLLNLFITIEELFSNQLYEKNTGENNPVSPLKLYFSTKNN